MEQKYSKYGYFFIAPFFVIFILFSLYPILYTLRLSFSSYKGYGDIVGVGFDNYVKLIGDAKFYEALMNTIKIWGVNIILQLGTAFILVMIFTDMKYKFKGLPFFRTVFYIPNLIAATTVSVLFIKLLNTDYGVINSVLYNLGFIAEPIQWLTEPWLAQMSVSSIQTWLWFGNSFILFMAAAQAVSKESFEAAAIDGAGRFQILKNITIPSIKPILIYVGITSLIGGLQLFDIPMLITDGLGAPEGALNTVVLYIYNLAFEYRNYGYAAAVSYGLFLIVLTVSVLFTYLTNRETIHNWFKERKKSRQGRVR